MQDAGEGDVFIGRGFGENGVGQKAFLVFGPDVFGGRCCAPRHFELSGVEQDVCFAAPVERHDQHAQAFFTRASGAAGAVQQGLAVIRQIGMNDKREIRQIETARRNVGGN